MDQPTLRDRLAPLLPYWGWVVVPALVLALIIVSARSAAQGRQLELVRSDVTALEQQLSVMKKSHGPASAAGLLAGLSAGEQGDPPVRHARKARGEARSAPRTGDHTGKKGGRRRLGAPGGEGEGDGADAIGVQ